MEIHHLAERLQHIRGKEHAWKNSHCRNDGSTRTWESMPDGIPDGDHVCHLIETFDGGDAEITEEVFSKKAGDITTGGPNV